MVSSNKKKQLIAFAVILIVFYFMTPTSEISRNCNYNTCACKSDIDCRGTCDMSTKAPQSEYGICTDSGLKSDKIESSDLGGIFAFSAPDKVRPDTVFTTKGTFLSYADGYYLLEVGPVECPGGCNNANIYSITALQASKSACDGNEHFSGAKSFIKKDDSVNFVFNVKSPPTEGTYKYGAVAFTNCARDGGKLITNSKLIEINVAEDAPELEVEELGNQPGTINKFFGGIKSFKDYLGLNKENKTTLFLILGIAGFIVILYFLRDKKD